jgi:hypothetical protein
MILLGIVNQLALILLIECEEAPKAHPTIGLLWAFHVHVDDEDVLREQIDRERVGKLDPTTAVDALNPGLDNNVDLMRCTPNPHNLVLDTRDNADHDTNVPTYHGFFTVSRHVDQLHAPRVVQHIHKLVDHIEDIERRVSFISMATRCRFTKLPW